MELNNTYEINYNHHNELPILPIEIWQHVVSDLDWMERLKFGIAVLGFENIMGCPSSILKAIKIQVAKLNFR